VHNPGRPVIFTSGYTDEETRERVEREGAAFLIKPYDIQGLSRAVRDALVLAEGRGSAAGENG